MKVVTKIDVELEAFSTPNFVRYDVEDRAIPLKEVDAHALSALCDAFRAEVFQKAGKKDPRLV